MAGVNLKKTLDLYMDNADKLTKLETKYLEVGDSKSSTSKTKSRSRSSLNSEIKDVKRIMGNLAVEVKIHPLVEVSTCRELQGLGKLRDRRNADSRHKTKWTGTAVLQGGLTEEDIHKLTVEAAKANFPLL